MPWTDDKVSQLRELWDQGLPTSQIGKILDFTKNAVVGKAHRIGLERRPSPIKRNIMKPNRKKARAPIVPDLSVSLKSDSYNEQKNGLKYNIESIKDKFVEQISLVPKKNIGCEWPNGHPNEIDFYYCGEEKAEGKPYCSKHCSKAYVINEKIDSKDAILA